jgi:flagellar hook assembly protein FlgD
VQLNIYDLSGSLVSTVVNEEKPAGEYSIGWDGEDKDGKTLSSGIYFYTLQAGENTLISRRMILIK